jgi:hypothetical protein
MAVGITAGFMRGWRKFESWYIKQGN